MTLLILEDCMGWEHKAQQYNKKNKDLEVTYTWDWISFISVNILNLNFFICKIRGLTFVS